MRFCKQWKQAGAPAVFAAVKKTDIYDPLLLSAAQRNREERKENQEGHEFLKHFREELGDKIRTNHWPETIQKCLILHVILSTETIKVVSATEMGSNAIDAAQPMASASRLNLKENLHKAFICALLCVGRRSGQRVLMLSGLFKWV